MKRLGSIFPSLWIGALIILGSMVGDPPAASADGRICTNPAGLRNEDIIFIQGVVAQTWRETELGSKGTGKWKGRFVLDACGEKFRLISISIFYPSSPPSGCFGASVPREEGIYALVRVLFHRIRRFSMDERLYFCADLDVRGDPAEMYFSPEKEPFPSPRWFGGPWQSYARQIGVYIADSFGEHLGQRNEGVPTKPRTDGKRDHRD